MSACSGPSNPGSSLAPSAVAGSSAPKPSRTCASAATAAPVRPAARASARASIALASAALLATVVSACSGSKPPSAHHGTGRPSATAHGHGGHKGPNSASDPGLPPFVLGTVTTDLPAFDSAIQHRANLRVMFIHTGGSYFPTYDIRQDVALGAQTVIGLEPRHVSIAQIAAGDLDNWLRNVFAADVAAVGHPLIVSFAPEMNGQWYGYGSTRVSPAAFVQAWRHVHAVLDSTNAGHLITWMWQPMAMHYGTASPGPWWPGSQYVNEVGLDGYYVNARDTFTLIFGQTISVIRSLTRLPIVIGEVAVGRSTGRQSGDIRNLFAGVRAYHLRGLVWFNIAQHNGVYHQDWRLQDFPAELSAFIAQVRGLH